MPGLARGIRKPGPVRPVRYAVDAAILVGSAYRRESVAPAEPGVLRVDEQVRPEHVVVLEFPQAVQAVQRPVERIEAALVPEKALVRGAGLARVAAELLLQPEEVEEGELVVLARGPVDLRVGVFQYRLVGRLSQTHDADV